MRLLVFWIYNTFSFVLERLYYVAKASGTWIVDIVGCLMSRTERTHVE